jgi:hypothetical protein
MCQSRHIVTKITLDRTVTTAPVDHIDTTALDNIVALVTLDHIVPTMTLVAMVAFDTDGGFDIPFVALLTIAVRDVALKNTF